MYVCVYGRGLWVGVRLGVSIWEAVKGFDNFCFCHKTLNLFTWQHQKRKRWQATRRCQRGRQNKKK